MSEQNILRNQSIACGGNDREIKTPLWQLAKKYNLPHGVSAKKKYVKNIDSTRCM